MDFPLSRLLLTEESFQILEAGSNICITGIGVEFVILEWNLLFMSSLFLFPKLKMDYHCCLWSVALDLTLNNSVLVPSNSFCPSRLIHAGCMDSGVSLVSELSWCEFRPITNCLCQCFPGVPAADLFARVPAEIILRWDISSRNLSKTQIHPFWCSGCSYRVCNVLFCVILHVLK